ncbi:MAG: hypothetical protein U5N55_04740 [Cypionkella sp.]|nr:hypothetical protein [Cypionkella sp.]
MKFQTLKPVTYDATHLRAELGVRYWEDAQVNGEDEDNEAPKMPFAKDGVWRITIDLATGAISDWPKGNTRIDALQGLR